MQATADRAFSFFHDVVLEEIEGDEDPEGFVYGMFICIIRFLAEGGWTSEELTKDIVHHVAHQTSDGQA